MSQLTLFDDTGGLRITTATPNEHGVWARSSEGVKHLRYSAKHLTWDVHILRIADDQYVWCYDFNMDTGSSPGGGSPLSKDYRKPKGLNSYRECLSRALYQVKDYLIYNTLEKGSCSSKGQRQAAGVALKAFKKRFLC